MTGCRHPAVCRLFGDRVGVCGRRSGPGSHACACVRSGARAAPYCVFFVPDELDIEYDPSRTCRHGACRACRETVGQGHADSNGRRFVCTLGTPPVALGGDGRGVQQGFAIDMGARATRGRHRRRRECERSPQFPPVPGRVIAMCSQRTTRTRLCQGETTRPAPRTRQIPAVATDAGLHRSSRTQ